MRFLLGGLAVLLLLAAALWAVTPKPPDNRPAIGWVS